ncbi:MAG: DUF2889 domain-containing protein [Leptospirales bacterium]|nr:DUF2889 domain-containing protein [Leptospirales bacterium]
MIKVLEQGAWINSVDSLNEKELVSQTMLLTTRGEYSAAICIKKNNFEITRAYYSIHRCPDMSKRTEADIPEFTGGSGLYERIKAVKDLRDFDGDGKIKELLLECLKGLILAESYLLEELGYKSREEYETAWQVGKEGYCRPFENQMPPIEEWPNYIGAYEYYRKKNLYAKCKSYVILQKSEDEAVINGVYNDSFHQMRSELSYNLTSRNINAFDMVVIRAPHPPCYELSHTAAQSFIGKPIDSFSKREVGKIIGGSPGCFHLVDIVSDMASAAIELPKT